MPEQRFPAARGRPAPVQIVTGLPHAGAHGIPEGTTACVEPTPQQIFLTGIAACREDPCLRREKV